MLQQTQVARVVPHWTAFLARFPAPAAFAQQPLATAIEAWAGLGYNRRAVNLHRAAGEIVREHGGRVPDALPALLALPGVGPYTARAVLIFAFEHDEAVLDTNVARIAARVLGRRLSARGAQTALDASVPPGNGWSWNQALMDVGAQHCRPLRPQCAGCPLAPRCQWSSGGRPEPDPSRGSAAVSSAQGRFGGSDRQGRGRLVAALRRGPVSDSALPAAMGWPDQPERAHRVAARLAAEGLIERRPDGYVLPGRTL